MPIGRRKFGKHGPQLSGLGLGCFGLSDAYGRADPAESIQTIHRALDLGCTLLDTADEYGAGHNELLLGRALGRRRHQAFLGTKFGLVWNDDGEVIGLNGHPDYVRRACEASLARLQTDVIDVYYLHRIDPNIPIEETAGAMGRLVEEGKVRYLGLSEASPEQIRRAYNVCPIAALQSEYSLWTREPEAQVLPLCRELGIAFVAFSPLGRGFFSGKLTPGNIGNEDFRIRLPRFQAEISVRMLNFYSLCGRWRKQRGVHPRSLPLPGFSRKATTYLPFRELDRPVTWRRISELCPSN